MTGRAPLGKVCGDLLRYDRDHAGCVGDVYALTRHGEIAHLLARLFRDEIRSICASHGWTAEEVADVLAERGISPRWIFDSGLGGVLDLAMERE